MFVIRVDSIIVGTFTCRQDDRDDLEELPDDHQEVVAFTTAGDARLNAQTKKRAALDSLSDKVLAASLTDPSAPQEVKDYAAAIAAKATTAADMLG